MKFHGTLDYAYALALLKPSEAITHPEHPPYANENQVLGDSMEPAEDPKGRRVFVDGDGGCFVHDGQGWVGVDVDIQVTVTPHVRTTKENS